MSRVCIQALDDAAYRPWIMPHAIGQHPLPNTHIPRKCMQALAKVACDQLTSLTWCTYALLDVCRLDSSCLSLADIFRPYGYATHNSSILHNTLVEWHMKATDNVGSLHSMLLHRCVKATDNTAKPCSTSKNQCVQVYKMLGSPHVMLAGNFIRANGEAGSPRLTPADRYVHAKSDAGQRQCGQAMLNVGLLWFVGQGRCGQSTRDICWYCIGKSL